MPAGGAFSAGSEASARLRAAVEVHGGRLQVRPAVARPSYCSGATYLVLLKVIAAAQASGALQLDAATVAKAVEASMSVLSVDEKRRFEERLHDLLRKEKAG